VCSLVFFVGCAKRTAPSAAARAPQILRLSQRNEPTTLDPSTTVLPDEFGILRALLEGLLIPGANGEPAPGAALRFEVSADGLVYTFHLRPDATWSNGDAVTADDFVASYRRTLTPATAAPKANVFFPVKNARAFLTGKLADFAQVGFRALNARTLVITLEQPTPRFPYYVASGPWLPVHVKTVAQHGRNWSRPEHFVGNGPFALAEWHADQRLVVKRNPRWHDAASVRLDEIHFVRFDSGDSEERAFRAGQIEATMSVPFSKVQTYDRERPAELHRAPMIETRYLAFNTRRPPLDDPRVRRALALAIDRQKIVDRVLRGGQPPAGRMVPPALRDGGAGSPSRPEFKAKPRTSTPQTQDGSESRPYLPAEHRFNPAEARRLLAEAGVTGANFPRFELTFWSNPAVLEAVQAMWRDELGLDVRIALHEARVHLNALATGDYDIAFATAIPDVADAAELLGDFVSDAPENNPHWRDAAFDALFARAHTLDDATAHAQALAAAEQRLLESAPVTPIYFNTKIWLMSPRVRGWQEDGLWARCYQNVYLDEK
jgi:oligopeptide transport system substrate-binding protein